MNKRRLLKLADLLEADAKNKKGVKFDLDQWGSTEKAKNFIKADCGTTACAVGLACVSGAFKRDGLKFGIGDDGGIWPIYDDANAEWFDRERIGEPAVMLFFDLSKRETRFLFFPRYYPKGKTRGAEGERAVAKRIREFVAGRAAPGPRASR